MRRRKQKDRKEFYGRLKGRFGKRDTHQHWLPDEGDDKRGPLSEENEGGISKDSSI